MTNEFYISAGLPAIDNSIGADANTLYITAGLVPDDVDSAVSFNASCSESSITTEAIEHFEFDLINPVDDATGEVLPVTFDWGSYPGASNYNLQVSDDVGFSNLVINLWTTQRTYESSELSGLDDYWWRVRAAA